MRRAVVIGRRETLPVRRGRRANRAPPARSRGRVAPSWLARHSRTSRAARGRAALRGLVIRPADRQRGPFTPETKERRRSTTHEGVERCGNHDQVAGRPEVFGPTAEARRVHLESAPALLHRLAQLYLGEDARVPGHGGEPPPAPGASHTSILRTNPATSVNLCPVCASLTTLPARSRTT